MPKTVAICFANNKGGSGKSTTCSNVGYFLAAAGKKVLLVDGDMQLNLSLAYFDEERVLALAAGEQNLYRALQKQADLSEYILPTGYDRLDIVPSSTLMSSVEFELFSKWQREYVLKKCLSKIKESGRYDYILLDSPPTLGCWVMNILAASDYLIVPVEASPWGLFGLSNLFEFLAQVKDVAPELQVAGIAITKVDGRKNYYKQTLETLQDLPAHLFSTHIHQDSNIEWAQDNSKPVGSYRRSCRSSQEYLALTKEVEQICR